MPYGKLGMNGCAVEYPKGERHPASRPDKMDRKAMPEGVRMNVNVDHPAVLLNMFHTYTFVI